MPHWGVQDLVNRWVNTNKTHYVFTDEAELKLAASDAALARSSSHVDISHKSKLRSVVKPDRSGRADNHKDEWSSIATPKTATTVSTGMSSLVDEGRRTKRNSGSKSNGGKVASMSSRDGKSDDRRGTDKPSGNLLGRPRARRGLTRTNSQSDLLKQKYEEEMQSESQQGRSGKGIRWRSTTTKQLNFTDKQADDDETPSRSVRRESNYSGDTDQPTYQLSPDKLHRTAEHPTIPRVDSRFRRRKHEHHPLSPHTKVLQHGHQRLNTNHVSLKNCESCHDTETELHTIVHDMEFLRAQAIREEFICASCSRDLNHGEISHYSSSHKNKIDFVINAEGDDMHEQESMVLTEASQHLHDVTSRHNKQLEEMTKERALWQNNYHLKLSKFTLLCKDLNDESAIQKIDAEAAIRDLQSVRTDRDSLASQLSILQERISHMERVQQENEILRERMTKKDNEMLNRAEEAICERDLMIVELSTRLELAMNTLKMERIRHRRRRIIFPASKHTPEENSTVKAVRELREQLEKVKQEKRELEERSILLEGQLSC